MRISDWSSDVCSSDLPRHHFRGDESGWWAARALDRCKRSVGQPPGAQDGCGVLRLPGRTAHWRALIHQSEQHLLSRRWQLDEIGRAYVKTTATNAPHVCRLMLVKKKIMKNRNHKTNKPYQTHNKHQNYRLH